MASLRQSATGTKHAFTLLELLVVMVIIALVMAMVMPAFDRLTVVSGVDGGAAMISGQLRACRQHAVAKRARVALLLYRNGYEQAIRVAQMYKDDTFSNWIPNSAWKYLPTGSVVEATAGTTAVAVPGALLSPVNTSNLTLPGVVFKPSGKVSTTNEARLLVSDALWNGSAFVVRGGGGNSLNAKKIFVNPFTGRVQMAGPENTTLWGGWSP